MQNVTANFRRPGHYKPNLDLKDLDIKWKKQKDFTLKEQ